MSPLMDEPDDTSMRQIDLTCHRCHREFRVFVSIEAVSPELVPEPWCDACIAAENELTLAHADPRR